MDLFKPENWCSRAVRLIREESFFFLSPTMEANNAEKEAQP